MEQSTPSGRTRKSHTRSKAGCLTCRKRHVRCDGNQPTCNRCIKAERDCDFGGPIIPLRDRRAKVVPGQQQPWILPTSEQQLISLKNPPVSSILDPFDAFSIQMPFKSKELLHYFHQSRDASIISPTFKEKDLLPAIVKHPDALRDTMLVAGLHYAWTVGGLREFEATFLFHMVELIQMLNEWIQSPQSTGFTTFMRHIATLCLTECSFGNVANAEAHLEGLMTVVDMHRPLHPDLDLDADIPFDDELAYRFLVLTYICIHGAKSRIASSKILTHMLGTSKVADYMSFISQIHKWHEEDIGCLGRRLEAAGLSPFFFGALPAGATFSDVDGLPMIECLRTLTKTTQLASSGKGDADPGLVWSEGAASRLDLVIAQSHIASLFGTGETTIPGHSQPRLMTSWCGVVIAIGLYLYSVLELWNGGETMEHRLYRQVIVILARDLNRSTHELGDANLSDFWFWKVFTGAYSLEKHQKYVEDETLQVVARCMDSFIRTWSQNSQVRRWEDAEKRLLKTTWNLDQARYLGRSIWERAIY